MHTVTATLPSSVHAGITVRSTRTQTPGNYFGISYIINKLLLLAPWKATLVVYREGTDLKGHGWATALLGKLKTWLSKQTGTKAGNRSRTLEFPGTLAMAAPVALGRE